MDSALHAAAQSAELFAATGIPPSSKLQITRSRLSGSRHCSEPNTKSQQDQTKEIRTGPETKRGLIPLSHKMFQQMWGQSF